jgi:hypothetical protein
MTDEGNHLVTTYFGPPVSCAHLEDLVAKDEREKATPADDKRKQSQLRFTRIFTSPDTIAALAHDKIAQMAEEAAIEERRKARSAKKAAKAAAPKPVKKPSKKA